MRPADGHGAAFVERHDETRCAMLWLTAVFDETWPLKFARVLRVAASRRKPASGRGGSIGPDVWHRAKARAGWFSESGHRIEQTMGVGV